MNKSIKRIFANKTLLITIIILAFITYLFFLVPIVIYPDSLGYYGYLKIFKGVDPISTWGLIRGPSFPLTIFMLVSIFGNAMLGLLIGAYIFFIGLLLIFYFTLINFIKRLGVNRTTGLVTIILFVILVVFNPILFGYSHALLTEFIATFFALVSCILSWLWLRIDFFRQRIKFILFGVTFAIIFCYIWFLKQPYITIAILPLAISCVISVVMNHKISNIMQRFGTLIFCIFVLFVAINGWRGFLIENGASQEAVNGLDNSVLGGGILKGLSDTSLSKKDLSVRQIDESIYLSSEDKQKAHKIFEAQLVGGKERVSILTIKSPSGKKIDEIPIFQATENLSTQEAVATWLMVSIKHPITVLSSYLSNYLAISDLDNFTAEPGNGALIPNKHYAFSGNENNSIGLWYLNYEGNMYPTAKYYWEIDKVSYGDLQYINNDKNPLIKVIFGVLWPAYLVFYSVMLIALPFLLIFSLIKYKKLFKDKNIVVGRVYELLIIIFGFSFLHVIFNVLLGAIIDRYVFPVYPAIVLGLILIIITNFRFNFSIDVLSKESKKQLSKKKKF